MTHLRIALADDHPIVLAGVESLLLATSDMEVVGTATTGPAALHMILSLKPDVAVIDISMPDLTGIELARRIARDYPAVRLLTLTVHEDPGYLHETLAAGVRGYLLKRSAADELVRAIRAVAAGGLFLDPAIAGKAVAAPQVTPVLRQQGRISAREAALSAREAALSAREEDVLRQTARGMGNKEIAAYLEISTKTVETYKARAIEKLGLRTRSDIVRYGAARGWLSELGSPASRP